MADFFNDIRHLLTFAHRPAVDFREKTISRTYEDGDSESLERVVAVNSVLRRQPTL